MVEMTRVMVTWRELGAWLGKGISFAELLIDAEFELHDL